MRTSEGETRNRKEIVFLFRLEREGNWILYSLHFVTSEQYGLKKDGYFTAQ
jgi:hypothetical protein